MDTVALEMVVPSTSLTVTADDSATAAPFSAHVTAVMSSVSVGASFTAVMVTVRVIVADAAVPSLTMNDKTFDSVVGLAASVSSYVMVRKNAW
jgi:hypothetical protein